MTLSKIPRPLTVSARKDSTWRTSKPVLGIRQLDHGFEQQALDNLISRIRTINKDRNRIVHSWWFTDHVGEASRLKTAKDGHDDSEDIDVTALAFSIHTLIDDFAKFVDELHEAKLIRKKPGISLDSLR